MRQLVIINRDGVINEMVEQGLLTPEQLRPLPGSLEAIARLNHAGVRVAVTTTQPKTPEGPLSVESLNSIHARLQQLLARRGGHIDAFFIDTDVSDSHAPVAAGEGLMETVFDRFSTTPQQAALIVHSSHFVENAQTTDVLHILVGTPSKGFENEANVHHSKDLMSATDYLLTS